MREDWQAGRGVSGGEGPGVYHFGERERVRQSEKGGRLPGSSFRCSLGYRSSQITLDAGLFVASHALVAYQYKSTLSALVALLVLEYLTRLPSPIALDAGLFSGSHA
jgi:hypothetical protein